MESIVLVKEEWGSGESLGEGLQHGKLLIRPGYEATKSESQKHLRPIKSKSQQNDGGNKPHSKLLFQVHPANTEPPSRLIPLPFFFHPEAFQGDSRARGGGEPGAAQTPQEPGENIRGTRKHKNIKMRSRNEPRREQRQ